MRRYSSEGCLLDVDVMPRQRIQLKDPPVLNSESCTYTDSPSEQARCATLPTTIRELGSSPGGAAATLTRDVSVSVEDLNELSKRKMDRLGVGTMGESFRAYSDGQLVPAFQGSSSSSTGSLERDDPRPSSPSDLSLKSQQHPVRAKAKLSAAKLHLKSLFDLVN